MACYVLIVLLHGIFEVSFTMDILCLAVAVAGCLEPVVQRSEQAGAWM